MMKNTAMSPELSEYLMRVDCEREVGVVLMVDPHCFGSLDRLKRYFKELSIHHYVVQNEWTVRAKLSRGVISDLSELIGFDNYPYITAISLNE